MRVRDLKILKLYRGKVEIANCIFCGKEFLKMKNKKSGTKHSIPEFVRSVNCITCSHKCSRKYDKSYKRKLKYLKKLKGGKK